MGDRRKGGSKDVGRGDAGRRERGGGGGGEDDWLNPMNVLDSLNSWLDGVRCCTTDGVRHARRASEWDQIVSRESTVSREQERMQPLKLVHMRFSQESAPHLQAPAFSSMADGSQWRSTQSQSPAHYKLALNPKDYDVYLSERSTDSTVSAGEDSAVLSSRSLRGAGGPGGHGADADAGAGKEEETRQPMASEGNVPSFPVKFDITAATMDRQLKDDLKMWGSLTTSWNRSLPPGSGASSASADEGSSPKSSSSSKKREEVL